MPIFVHTAMVNSAERPVSVAGVRRVVFVRCGRLVRRTHWTSGSLEDLQLEVLRVFDAPPELIHARGRETASGFVLAQSTRVNAYLDAEPLVQPDDLGHGAVVSVRDPLWQAVCTACGERGSRGEEEPCPPNLRRAIEACVARVLSARRLPAKDRVFLLLNDPTSSREALIAQTFILFLILLSTITFVMETIPWFYEDDAGYDHWFAIETVCIVFFTAELGGRFWSARDRKKFSKKFLNWVDLVAILPYYIELFSRGGAEVPGLAVLRAIRLARVFRLMKVSKRSLKMLGTTMVKSGKSLNVLFFLLLISLVVFSALMYFAERGSWDETQGRWFRTTGYTCSVACSDQGRKLAATYVACGYSYSAADTKSIKFNYHRFGQYSGALYFHTDACVAVTEESPFQSIPHSMWFSAVTMATLGYGDVYPVTGWGFLVAAVQMLYGILVVAMPVTVVGSNFTQIYNRLSEPNALLPFEGTVPTGSVVQHGLHEASEGARAAPLTRSWLSPLSHEWDVDLRFAELLPCKAPAIVRVFDVKKSALVGGGVPGLDGKSKKKKDRDGGGDGDGDDDDDASVPLRLGAAKTGSKKKRSKTDADADSDSDDVEQYVLGPLTRKSAWVPERTLKGQKMLQRARRERSLREGLDSGGSDDERKLRRSASARRAAAARNLRAIRMFQLESSGHSDALAPGDASSAGDVKKPSRFKSAAQAVMFLNEEDARSKARRPEWRAEREREEMEKDRAEALVAVATTLLTDAVRNVNDHNDGGLFSVFRGNRGQGLFGGVVVGADGKSKWVTKQIVRAGANRDARPKGITEEIAFEGDKGTDAVAVQSPYRQLSRGGLGRTKKGGGGGGGGGASFAKKPPSPVEEGSEESS